MVVVSFLSGLWNAYRSVLSNCGCPEISGASRWLDAAAVPGGRAATPAVAIPPTASAPAVNGATLLRPPCNGLSVLLMSAVIASVLRLEVPALWRSAHEVVRKPYV